MNGRYEPLWEKAVWAKRALVLAVLADIAGLLVDGAQYSLLQKATWGGVTLGEVEANDTRQAVVGFVQLAVLVVAAVFFLRWFRRAYENAPAISALRPRWTPGWAIGYWFVPIYSFFRPKQIANEIWESADPQSAGKHRLVDFWWSAWVIAGFLTLVAINLSNDARDVGDFKTFTEIYLVSDIASIAAGVLALRFVAQTTEKQHEQAIRASTRAYA